MLEKGTRAFMSCVRAYKEHQCNFIFRIAKLVRGNDAHTASFGAPCLCTLCAGPTLRPCDNTRLARELSQISSLLDHTIGKGPPISTARVIVPPLSQVRPSALRMPILCMDGGEAARSGGEFLAALVVSFPSCATARAIPPAGRSGAAQGSSIEIGVCWRRRMGELSVGAERRRRIWES